MLWGQEDHVRSLFGNQVGEITTIERTCMFRFTSPEAFVSYFRRYYGPTNRAFEKLDEVTRSALAADLADLARKADVHQDGGSIAVPSTYVETIAQRA